MKMRNYFLTFVLLSLWLRSPGARKSRNCRRPRRRLPAPLRHRQLRSAPIRTSFQPETVQLSWQTTNATSISIDGIGDIPSVGVKTVTPTDSTTYHLVARGDGGSADASARVTVNSPPAVSVPSNAMSEADEFKARCRISSSIMTRTISAATRRPRCRRTPTTW